MDSSAFLFGVASRSMITRADMPPDLSKRIGFSKEIISGRLPYPDVVKDIYDDINKRYGTNVKAPE